MKITLISAMIVALGTGAAFAADEPSGRPSAVLDQAECQNVWKAESDGDAIKSDRAEEIVNFPLTDNDDNGKISQQEFVKACELGWVNTAALEGSQPKSD